MDATRPTELPHSAAHPERTAGLALRLAALLALLWVVGSPLPLHAQSASGITSPAPGTAVAGTVPIMGTAVIEPFQKYELHYKLEPSGDDAYVYFDGGTSPVTNGQLGVWQAGGLAPGTYSIRLRVVKADGNYAEFFSSGLSVNQGPAATPTPDPDETTPTPTPIPTATFTPAPQPTPAVGEVTQPEAVQGILAPTPTPTPTVGAVVAADDAASQDVGAAPAGGEPAVDTTSADTVSDSAGSVTRELGEALSLERLRGYFFTGVRLSAFVFFLVFLIFGGKRLFTWARGQYF